jgi:hypothetical protein
VLLEFPSTLEEDKGVPAELDVVTPAEVEVETGLDVEEPLTAEEAEGPLEEATGPEEGDSTEEESWTLLEDGSEEEGASEEARLVAALEDSTPEVGADEEAADEESGSDDEEEDREVGGDEDESAWEETAHPWLEDGATVATQRPDTHPLPAGHSPSPRHDAAQCSSRQYWPEVQSPSPLQWKVALAPGQPTATTHAANPTTLETMESRMDPF